jgi:hypothetical protein
VKNIAALHNIDTTEPRILRVFSSRFIYDLAPGIVLYIFVAFVSLGADRQGRVLEHPYIETLGAAILLGMVLRTFWEPRPRKRPGIAVSAKQLLEVAKMLPGALIGVVALIASGPAFLRNRQDRRCHNRGTLRDRQIVGAARAPGDFNWLGKLDLWQFCDRRRGSGDWRGGQGHRIFDRVHRDPRRTHTLGLALLIPLMGIPPTRCGILVGL